MPDCCYRCFKHPWLKRLIHESATKLGTCAFCGSREVALSDVGNVRDPLLNVVSLYTALTGDALLPWENPIEIGDTLEHLLQEDWDLFSDALIDSGQVLDLIHAIDISGWEKDSGEDLIDTNELYIRPRNLHQLTPTEAWDQFRNEVRGNPDVDPDLRCAIEDDLFRGEKRIPKGTELFRARPGCHSDDSGINKPYVDGDIGVPPVGKARPARLSRQGEVLLYCADQETTAVAEIRPWRGLIVTLARFRARSDLRVLDLRRYLPGPNPFTTEYLSYEIEITHLLNGFADDLSLPLERPDDEFGYLPSQKLADIIRAADFDGVRYKSAMQPNETNVALFDPAEMELSNQSWFVSRPSLSNR